MTNYDIYIHVEGFGGKKFFESKSPEITTFSGVYVADDHLPLELSEINHMFVKRNEIYHTNNDPITYYSPTTVNSNVYAFNNNTSYPLSAGGGIALQFIDEDDDGNGYVKITNTLSSATAPAGTT